MEPKNILFEFDKLKDLYLFSRSKGFRAKTNNQEIFLNQHFIICSEEPTEEDVWMLRDVLEANAERLFRINFPEPDPMQTTGRAEQAYSKACIKKFWGDIDYIIDELTSAQ